ncbi:unnamed protein product [Closterium sp. NIES-54]
MHQDPSLKLEFLSNFFSELALTDYSCLRFKPSCLAASAVLLAKLTLFPTLPPWVRRTPYPHPSLLVHTFSPSSSPGSLSSDCPRSCSCFLPWLSPVASCARSPVHATVCIRSPVPSWLVQTAALAACSGYACADLRECVACLHALHSSNGRAPPTAVHQKYCQAKVCAM